MARTSTLLVLLSSMALWGCGPGVDPNLSPNCNERTHRSVIVGTGEEEFELAGSNVSTVYGSQGGSHIWLGLRTKDMGPEINATFEIRDAADDTVYTEPLKLHLELSYNSDTETNDVAGITGFLQQCYDVDCKSPEGRDVILFAEVTDQCDVPTTGETQTHVQ